MIPKIYCCALALVILMPIASIAQSESIEIDQIWLSMGLGGYNFPQETSGFSFELAFNVIHKKTLYKARFIAHQEFNLFGPSPQEGFLEAGFLLGRFVSHKYFLLQLSGGLGVVGGVKRGDLLHTPQPTGLFSISDPREFEEDRFITPAIPLEMGIQLKPIKYFAFGASIFGNLNFERPLYGLVLKCSFGKLR